jgi:large subunit ribosomal protein L4
MPDFNDNVYMSLQNVPTVLGVLNREINTYDVINSEVVVLTESAAKQFSETNA